MKQIKGFIVKANYTRYSFAPGEGQTALDFAKIAARSMVKDTVSGGVDMEVITEDEPCTTATTAATDSPNPST